MNRRTIYLVVGMILISSLAAACGGAAAPEPEPTLDDSPQEIAEAVNQTIAAIAVAETIAALAADATAIPESSPVAQIDPTATAAPPDPTNDAPTATEPPPPPPPTSTTAVRQPPNVQNDIPGGACERTDHIKTRIQEDPNFLYRVYALDNRVGTYDGDGILSVRFTIFDANGQVYFREERTAGYCIFGGGEPNCNVWPSDAQGVFTWGDGGAAVEPGVYGVFIEVESDASDPATESNVCNWNFDMTVTLP
jgi:hypothetical protein